MILHAQTPLVGDSQWIDSGEPLVARRPSNFIYRVWLRMINPALLSPCLRAQDAGAKSPNRSYLSDWRKSITKRISQSSAVRDPAILECGDSSPLLFPARSLNHSLATRRRLYFRSRSLNHSLATRRRFYFRSRSLNHSLDSSQLFL